MRLYCGEKFYVLKPVDQVCQVSATQSYVGAGLIDAFSPHTNNKEKLHMSH